MMNTHSVIENVIKDIIDKVEFLECKRKNTLINDENCYQHSELISRNSSGLERCRICFDTNCIIPVSYPCNCKGTIGAVHLICLERWLQESNSDNCELCGYKFSVIRVPRYNVLKSFWIWLRSNDEEYRSQVRSLRTDIIRCLVITPLTIVCSYMCMIVTNSYSLAYHNGYIMMATLIISYFIWVYLTTQYHHRIWFYWWKKKTIVKILLHKDDSSLTQDA